MSFKKGEARNWLLFSILLLEKIISIAECKSRCCTVAAKAACTLLSALGTAAARCIKAGSSGLGRAGGGQIWSFMPITHMASTGELSASIMPKICMLDSPSASAWNTCSLQIC